MDERILEGLTSIAKVAVDRPLGIKRWDLVLATYKASGSVVIPVQVATRVMRDPFYYVHEAINDQGFLFVKPVIGDPYSLGSVYGFFGLSDFKGYKKGTPIVVVEGIADWAVVKQYYQYVLCALTANLTARQLFFLSGLTDKVYLGFDCDSAGVQADRRADVRLGKLGVSVDMLVPFEKDWGKVWEDSYSRERLDGFMDGFLNRLNAA